MLRSALLLAFLQCALSGAAQLLTPDTLSWSMANGAQCVKAADLDNDGDNDLVVGTLRGHHVLLYMNPGDGQFGAPSYAMEAEGVYDLELADLDLDGDPDIVVADFGNGWVSWCANLGAGTFAPREVLIDDNFTTGITAIEIGEGDGDPQSELFTLNYGGRGGVFQNNGEEDFGTGQTLFTVGPPAFGLAIFDYEGTFRYDVVGGGDELWMRSNTGGGFLAASPVQLTSGGGDVSAISFSRGQGGGLQDVSLYVASEGTGQLRIWDGFENGTPSLTSTIAYDGITDIVHYPVDPGTPGIYNAVLASHTQHWLIGPNPLWNTNSKAWGLRGICIAELDGDGEKDLAWAGDEDDDVAWVRGGQLGPANPEYRMTPLSGGTVNPRFADLDGDTDLDGVIPFREGRSIGWIENLGNGDFSSPIAVSVDAYDHRHAIPADIDGDGNVDILTAFADDSLLYFPNDGSGAFGPPVTISTEVADGTYLDAQDMDGDGDTDILTVDHFANGVPEAKVLFLNDGTGNFSSADLADGPPRFWRVLDLDGDALPDVVDVDNDNVVFWYKNLGGGVFANFESIVEAGAIGTVRALCTGDVDVDGDTDLLLSGDNGAVVYWAERTTTGWDAPVEFLLTAEQEIISMVMADFDDDGDEDLLAGHYEGGRVIWYTNNGGLVFGEGEQLTDELVIAEHVSVADLNGDGHLDGVAASSFGDRVLCFLNGSDINTAIAEPEERPLQAFFLASEEAIIVQLPSAVATGRLNLVDAAGRTVKRQRTSALGVQRIPVPGLSSGIYMVVFEVDGGLRSGVICVP